MRFLKFLFLFSILGFFSILNAKEVPLNIAKKVASNFYAQSKSDAQINWEKLDLLKSDSKVDLYIFNSTTYNSFVIVSGEDNVNPIIAYSFDNIFEIDNLSPALQHFLNGYQQDINEVRKASRKQMESVAKEWQNLIRGNSQAKNGAKNVAPMISTEWGQGCYYNVSCPVDNAGDCNRALVGCVATAMAQVIKYHEFPANGYGSHSYNHPKYGTLSVNYANQNYNYSNMPNSLSHISSSTQKQAIGDLSYHCGVGVEMNYGPNGSGSNNQFARDAMVKYFNYKSVASLEMAVDYSTIDWINKIKEDLDNGRPVLYSAVDNSTNFGHAFILDGYQSTASFHVNWGWEGYNDGYFLLNSLDPATYNFDGYHDAIFNLMPAEGCSSGLVTLNANNGEIDDGSGYNDYKNNSSCTWLIAPKSQNVVSLYFEEFKTESNNDVLEIYNGTSASAPLLATLSGNSLPNVITANSGKMFLKFTTNSSITKSGWKARYTNSDPIFCSANNILTTSSGYISDGSGKLNYLNNTYCKWIIMPSSASFIGINFLKMDIHSSDVLKIYNGPNSSYPLLGTFNGNTLPASIASTNSKVMIEFSSNGSSTASGFSLSYHQNSPASIDETSNDFEFNVYPSPADDVLNIDFQSVNSKSANILIYNNLGQLVKNIDLELAPNNSAFKININDLGSGLYFVKLNSEDITKTSRFIKR
jgi:hypothetical protein